MKTEPERGRPVEGRSEGGASSPSEARGAMVPKLLSPLFLLIALAACDGGAEHTSTVQLALSGVPESVKTIAVSVFDPARGALVASATAAAPVSTFELGVPAEVPLEFRVVARTAQPGPSALGGVMPAYVARALQTIPLGREQRRIALLALPAGVLTTEVVAEDGVVSGEVKLRLVSERERTRPVEITFDPRDPQLAVEVLRSGRYAVELVSGSREIEVVGGEGLFVARELESVARVRLGRSVPVVGPDQATRLVIELVDDRGVELAVAGQVRTSSVTSSQAVLRVVAVDVSGRSVEVPDALVSVSVSSVPEGVIAMAPTLTARGLPARFSPLVLRGTGRLSLRAVAAVEDESSVAGQLDLDVIGPGVQPGRSVRLQMAIADPEALESGTTLELSFLDARGLYAAAVRGELSLEGSDPWVYFPDGARVELSRDEPGLASHRVARPSSPRGLGVNIRAVFTSTSPPMVLTSTLTLPVL